MSTEEFIIALFVRVDDAMLEAPLHPQGLLYPSEIVTLGLLYALKGGGQRAFYRWLTRDYGALFPFLPERTRLFRLLLAHQDWTQRVLAAPTVLGVADTYSIELVHPWRAHRHPFPWGEKGLSNHRWIVRAKLAVVLNTWGLVCAWDAATANVHDSAFHGLIRRFDGLMIVLTDQDFVAHKAATRPP